MMARYMFIVASIEKPSAQNQILNVSIVARSPVQQAKGSHCGECEVVVSVSFVNQTLASANQEAPARSNRVTVHTLGPCLCLCSHLSRINYITKT